MAGADRLPGKAYKQEYSNDGGKTWEPYAVRIAPTANALRVPLPATAAGCAICVVVNDQRIVEGRLRHSALEADASATVEEAMQPGPTTIRADTPLDEMMSRLRDRNVADVLVTAPEGELIGLLRREPAK